MSTPDLYAGMSPEDAERARAYLANQVAIQQKREAHARALLAGPEPAASTKAAWRPINDLIDAKKAPGGSA